MAKIVRLSAIHSLASKTTVINAFAALSTKYSSSYCPGFFSEVTTFARVAYLYTLGNAGLIEDYRTGRKNTAAFFEGLLDLFPFLRDPNLNITPDDRERILAKKDQLLSLRGITDPTGQQLAVALLEEAWNSLILFKPADKFRLEHLQTERTYSDEPIYCIAKSNELNIHFFLQQLREHYPELQVSTPDQMSISAGNDPNPIKIAPNLYLCLEHRYNPHLVAAAVNNNGQQPTILGVVIKQIREGNPSENIEVISAGNDLVVAAQLGISADNIHEVGSYFPVYTPAVTSKEANRL